MSGWEEIQAKISNLPDAEMHLEGTYTREGWTQEEMQAVIGENQPTLAVEKWADPAMYRAAPMVEDGNPIRPQVTLVSMTQNPLRVMAAASEMYSGHVIRDPSSISRAVAEAALHDMSRTTLKAPLEFIDLHFMLEGVTRALTHQLVRQRTAVYVQESLRFAVKDVEHEVAVPPSIAALKDDDPRRIIWFNAVAKIGWSYRSLVAAGIPAEDARGLLPSNIATRVHYKTNLRNLLEQSGVRLCSQAQFEWKQVWSEIIQRIRHYGPISERWQQLAIVNLFRPVCYRTGKCEFMSSTDRYCRIRDRVEGHHAKGEAPDTWTDIDPIEPLIYGAARPGGHQYELYKSGRRDWTGTPGTPCSHSTRIHGICRRPRIWSGRADRCRRSGSGR